LRLQISPAPPKKARLNPRQIYYIFVNDVAGIVARQ